ncbi:uncharacterized protein LOC110454683 [Mizuhopecten yessoensis]|uniref:uncharacterized protein LOC110454683 n=1 Tax=Mizuhopecten yessoensis TaxID=6573 RepID=UPI000B459BC0|nr:uncharacterized protein LOC110454683 [Mizuhopecten yessoensis]
MFDCRDHSRKRCPRTSTKPSSNEQQTTPQPNGVNATVIALGVVAVIGILLLAVVLGIIIYRRMRTQKPKTNLEPPVQIQNLSGSLENKYSDMDEFNSGKCIGNHSEVEYSSCQENDNTDNIYNRIDEGSSGRRCEYDNAIFIDRQVDTERNDHTPGDDTGDDTYNTLHNMAEDENTDDYAHARVVNSLQESSMEEGTLGENNDDYDRLSHKPNNIGVNSSENDYDHMVKGEVLPSYF